MEAECEATTAEFADAIYEYNLEQHAVPALGQLPIRELTRGHIESRLSGLQQEGYAVSTLRSVRAALSTVLEAAVSRQLISENPAHRLRIRESGEKRVSRFYRPEEVLRLLQKLSDPCRSGRPGCRPSRYADWRDQRSTGNC